MAGGRVCGHRGWTAGVPGPGAQPLRCHGAWVSWGGSHVACVAGQRKTSFSRGPHCPQEARKCPRVRSRDSCVIDMRRFCGEAGAVSAPRRASRTMLVARQSKALDSQRVLVNGCLSEAIQPAGSPSCGGSSRPPPSSRGNIHFKLAASGG